MQHAPAASHWTWSKLHPLLSPSLSCPSRLSSCTLSASPNMFPSLKACHWDISTAFFSTLLQLNRRVSWHTPRSVEMLPFFFFFCLISFFIVDIYYVPFFCSVFMHRVHHLVEIIALWNINRTLKRLYWVKWMETGCFNTARTGEKSRLTAELHRPETSRLLLLLRCLCGTSAGQELLLEISIFFFL